MTLLKRYLRLELATLLKNNIRFHVIGRKDELSTDVQHELDLAAKQTEQNTGMWFNIALNYGGRAEIVDAARRADCRRRRARTKSTNAGSENSSTRQGSPIPTC